MERDAEVLGSEGSTRYGLLQEHLKGDRLWKLLAQWKKISVTHLMERVAAQYKTVAFMEDKTGYRLVDKDGSP